jgi:hypothetical protein
MYFIKKSYCVCLAPTLNKVFEKLGLGTYSVEGILAEIL